VSFVALGVGATILQAWLWGFPMLPDPGGPDPHGKSSAPRLLTNLHRLMGLAFVIIYVIMMVEMLPRLWEYQVELPPRTIVHACMGILIGVLLVTKISIIRWFQHFGAALPKIGLGILTCTLILAVLSIPYSLQAHGLGDTLEPQNLARVEKVLGTVPELASEAKQLATAEQLEHGRNLLVTKCVVCHDLRTILKRPRTAPEWHDVVERMLEKPSVSRPLEPEDVPPVTAYLVGITPDLKASKKRQKVQEEAAKAATAEPPAPATPPAPGEPAAPVPPAFDAAKAKQTFENDCSQCHEITDVQKAAPQDRAGWNKVIDRMVAENEAKFAPEARALILEHLVRTMGKPEGAAPPPAATP
jgi:mono/diheme cytochrome c family protein